MSLNVYFTPEVEKNVPNFKRDSHKDGSEKLSVCGLSLYKDDGRLYAILGQLDRSRVSDELEQYVDEFSFYGSLPGTPARETGVYTYESATAELEQDNLAKVFAYRVKISAKKLEDIRTLLHQIKVGSIRPDESYEGPQGGMSRAELEAELERTRSELEDVRKELSLSETTFYHHEESFRRARDKNVAFRQLANILHVEEWPLCTKERVVRMMREILDKEGRSYEFV